MIFTLVYFVSYEVSFYNFIDYNLCLDYSIEFENWQHIGHGVYKYKIWDSEHYIKCNFLKTSKLDSISILAKPDAEFTKRCVPRSLLEWVRKIEQINFNHVCFIIT